MKTSRFDFHLPEQLIAQEPLASRDASRLLAVDRAAQSWTDAAIGRLPEFLRAGDLLILNDTRVIPARLRSTRDASGGKVEILLLPPPHPEAPGPQQGLLRRVLLRAGGRLKTGESFTLAGGCQAVLRERQGEAGDVVEFLCGAAEFDAYVSAHGEVPLPPYILRPPGPSSEFDRARYQTIFAQQPGAVAAPTAGLHFSEALFAALRARGVDWKYVTLHVGPGTFRPVKAETVQEHFVDPEPYVIPAGTAEAVLQARREGRRVIAVGTTSLRALEGGLAPRLSAENSAHSGSTGIFIYPPFHFHVADGLLTNFHVPKSSLLMLVCAFAAPGGEAGIELVQRAYEYAVREGYRFYSYGDACLFL